MADITKKEINHIAKLANIKISDKEIEKFQKQLSIVLDYVSELNQVDTKDTKPTSQTTGLENIKREDLINNDFGLNIKEVLSGTDEMHNDYFKVPAILEK